jgi:hypothetical protein
MAVGQKNEPSERRDLPPPKVSNTALLALDVLMGRWVRQLLAMTATSTPFVVARNKHIAPKERRIERLPSGYAVREFRDDSQGRYWYVVVALEVLPINKGRPQRA